MKSPRRNSTGDIGSPRDASNVHARFGFIGGRGTSAFEDSKEMQTDFDMAFSGRAEGERFAGLVDNDELELKANEENHNRLMSRRFSLPIKLERMAVNLFRRRKSAKAIHSEMENHRELLEEYRHELNNPHIRMLLMESIEGFVDSQFSLGYCFDVGAGGVQPNSNHAIYWYEIAANQGHVIAQNNLGVIFSTGHRGRMAKDWPEALHWYMKSARGGNPNAQFHVGLAFMNGEGVDGRDDAEAFRWFKLAAKQGHILAQSNVGSMYMGGRGVEKNYKKAYKWLKKAAGKGDAVSLHNLGVMFLKGFGVIESVSTAEDYFRLCNHGKNAGVISDELSRSVRESGSTLYNS